MTTPRLRFALANPCKGATPVARQSRFHGICWKIQGVLQTKIEPLP
jgi:hypothetical protein